MHEPLLQMVKISKFFGQTKVLDQVDLNLYHGQVMGLIGENGAGKSTIIKCLAGIYQLDSGKMIWKNHEIKFKNINQAKSQGIAVVHQELQLATNLSVAENIFLGKLPHRYGLVSRQTIEAKAQKYLSLLNSEIKPSAKVDTLSLANQQIVEIARALATQAQVIILDEPTDALSQEETNNLFQIIKKLQKQGVSFLYVTHRMAEIHQICQKITVLRDGKLIKETTTNNIKIEQIIKLMIGRDLTKQYPPHLYNLAQAPIKYRFQDFNNKYVKQVNLSIKTGEIFALVGLIGAGRSEFVRSIIGALPKNNGNVIKFNTKLKITNLTKAIKNRIYYVTENRKLDGLNLEASISDNIMLSSYQQVQNRWTRLINYWKVRELVAKMVKQLQIKINSPRQKVKELSGGNQQKVLLAKALLTKPDLLIFDEPTRGVDVGARQQIYQVMRKITEQGTTILMISSELAEAIGLADRIGVFCEGKLTGILNAQDFSEEKIMQLATNTKGPSHVSKN